MKCQITLVGGQLLPVYVGIKEFNPDQVHFIASDESKGSLAVLKSFFRGKHLNESTCNAYDFDALKRTCERILNKLDPEDDVTFNLTGGTKLMMLAAHAVMHAQNRKGFYINQDNSVIEFPTLEKRQIRYELTTKEFLDLSGHTLSAAKALGDYSTDDIKTANAIDNFAIHEYRKYTSITGYFRRNYSSNQPIPKKGSLKIENGISIAWNAASIDASMNGKVVLGFKSSSVHDLFFHAGWWELLVASEISKWNKAKEVLIKCELPFKSDKETKKNEIDILINLGRKLIFVECKSGLVKQDDVNKMRLIKQTYGGVISKSLLVSRYLPSTTILEKCKELDIAVFYCYAFNRQVNPLSKLISTLNELDKKLFA